MSTRIALAACMLLAALPAGAAEPATVEASPRFVEIHARIGFPFPSVGVVFGKMFAVDLAGIYLPWTPMGTPAGAATLQAGPMYRFGERNAEGTGQTVDLRLLGGACMSTAVEDTLPPQIFMVPGIIASVAVEWTKWVSPGL